MVEVRKAAKDSTMKVRCENGLGSCSLSRAPL